MFCTGSDKGIILQGNIGEIGDVTGFQAVNDAANANTDFGIRANTIRFATTTAERARVTDNGITFNGDTAAANALDDYEEGVWYPVIATQNGNTNATYTYNQGYYTKIGRIVYASAYVAWTGATNHSGYIYFNNFPFSSANLSQLNQVGTVMMHSLPFPSNHTDACLYMGSNSPGTNLYYSGSNTGWAAGGNSNSGEIIFSITYTTS